MQINYIIGYICFKNFLYFSGASEDDFLDLDCWYKQYFLASLINYAAINKLNIKNFILSDLDYLYKTATI